MKILLSFLLVLTLSVKADFFGDIGDWFEASSLIRDAAAPIAAIGSIANMNIGSYVIEFMSKSILSP
jgi:hypothetical protein